MIRKEPNKTTELVPTLKAIEAQKPPEERFYNDYLAEHFARAKIDAFRQVWSAKRFENWLFSRVNSDVKNYVLICPQYIDDYLQDYLNSLDDTIRQVVFLGAGYDTRAYRIPELKNKTIVFEVDYPNTIQQKKEMVKNVLGHLPDYVKYITLDPNAKTLNDYLLNNGYDPQLKTAFIWEYVTYYITTEAVDSVLDFVVSYSPTGSSIIFDYMPTSIVDGSTSSMEAQFLGKIANLFGEPFKFGIDPENIETFLTTRGFDQIKSIDHTFLEDKYMTGPNQGKGVSSFFHIVQATVRGN